MYDLPFLAVSLLVCQTFFNLGKLGYVLHDKQKFWKVLEAINFKE
jgi:hypothetical protein